MQEFLQPIVAFLDEWFVQIGFDVGGQRLPLMVIILLGTGIYLTLRTGFVQIRRLAHGFAVTSGKYDDPDEPGDVSHFQALTTALSATVGIGNIAGVAIAIHWGGPGAVFWMWMTAVLGMATKYTEVTLAQRYRNIEGEDKDPTAWEGTVSGGPMYYIERGLGPKWKPMAVFFAVMLGFTAFLTGNAVQANTVADTMETMFGVPVWITGLCTAGIVSLVIIGGISRIGKVTGILAPVMAAIYVFGALIIIGINADQVVPAFQLIFSEAFSPSAGVAGTGAGAFLLTMMYGVQRGLFSNEAGQGSAPIAHAAAKTDEPVSEGVVALLEPFIDTIVICTMTALVIITTGAWDDRVPTDIALVGGDLGWVYEDEAGVMRTTAAPDEVQFENGRQIVSQVGAPMIAWHEVAVEELWEDAERTRPFTGRIVPAEGRAVSATGGEFTVLYGDAAESGAPLTMLGFQRGLPGTFGQYIVILSVLLFAISTAISWSYYGDRCANYLFGVKSIMPYKFIFVGMHFVGAVVTLNTIWALGDVALAIVIWPNLIALILLAPKVTEMTKSYFERKPWVENYEAHQRYLEDKRAGRR